MEVVSGRVEKALVDMDNEGGPVIAPDDIDSGVGLAGVSRPAPDLRPIVVATAAYSVAHYFAFTRLVRGNIFNSYPFIPNDGFDWLLEGYALSRWVHGVTLPELPFARSPGFVGVTFADFFLGVNGDLIFAVIAGSVFVSIAATLLIAHWRRIPRYQAAVVALAVALSPLGFFRMVVLADQLAAALLVVSAVALYPYLTRGRRPWLAVATVAAALGGMTQAYGMMAFLVIAGWCFAVSVRRRRPDRLLAAALVIPPVVTVAVSKLWLSSVPHADTPNQLSLIKFNFNMLGFYANAWTFAFASLIPLIVVLVVRRRREVMASPVLSGYWLAVLALMASTFVYQFEEFRFTIPTSLMLGVAVMATLSGERPLPRPRELFAATALLAILAGIFVVPTDYWRPKLSNIEVDPSSSYFWRVLDADPLNRFEIEKHCQSSFHFCNQILLPESIPATRRRALVTYQYLVNLGYP